MKIIKSYESFNNDSNVISDNLKYYLNGNTPILEIFRPGSKAFFELIVEAGKNKNLLNETDRYLFENTDLGNFTKIDGKLIPLDLPMLNLDRLDEEAKYKDKNVKLNRPMRSGGPKKYKVYVKDPKTGNIKVVHFGDIKGGLTSKINDPEARRRFSERHKCSTKKDKTKPGWWSCNLPRYAKYLGLSGGGNYFW